MKVQEENLLQEVCLFKKCGNIWMFLLMYRIQPIVDKLAERVSKQAAFLALFSKTFIRLLNG